uniref:RHS repeat domain-containing protein n=1 Tax=Anatilimnocola aggregata TaxID=2528021 RepID=UPI0036F4AC00
MHRQTGVQLPDPDGPGVLAAPVYAYKYDAAHQLTRVTDPLSRVTNYAYDALGRLITTTLPDPDRPAGFARVFLRLQ